MITYSLIKRNKRWKKFNKNQKCLIIGYCVKFIDKNIKLLLISKGIYFGVKNEVYKYNLLRNNLDRTNLWIKLLGVNEKTIIADYEAHRILASQELPKSVQDAIAVDTSRSFKQLATIVSNENLTNILHSYAVEDLSMEYC